MDAGLSDVSLLPVEVSHICCTFLSCQLEMHDLTYLDSICVPSVSLNIHVASQYRQQSEASDECFSELIDDHLSTSQSIYKVCLLLRQMNTAK